MKARALFCDWDALQYTATYCNTLQPTATHCNMVQHTAVHWCVGMKARALFSDCNTLQHAAKCCNMLQRSAPYCNALQHIVTHCNTLQHAATHCNTLAGPQRCVGMKARAHQACHKQLTSLFTIAAKSDDRLENVFSKIAWRIKNTRECVLESIW